MSNEESREVRTMYEPGPSGTAVAALVIALIACVLAMCGMFWPMTDNQADKDADIEVARQLREQAKPSQAGIDERTIRAIVRDELSRAYLVPQIGLDPGAEPGSNGISIPARKELHFQRTW